jgi:hypothetical protein
VFTRSFQSIERVHEQTESPWPVNMSWKLGASKSAFISSHALSYSHNFTQRTRISPLLLAQLPPSPSLLARRPQCHLRSSTSLASAQVPLPSASFQVMSSSCHSTALRRLTPLQVAVFCSHRASASRMSFKRPSMLVHHHAPHPPTARVCNADAPGGFRTSFWSLTRTKS